jgi:enoyl-CoA hydratase
MAERKVVAMPGEYETIELEIEHPLATLTLNRPQALNAISRAMMDEVTAALAMLRDDDGVRCVILRGAGRCFSAGYDIGAARSDPAPSPASSAAREQMLVDWELSFWSFPKPIVAAVHGYCLAGACEVMMLCDLAVASDDARFGEPEIRFSAGPPALIMPWLVGIRAAKELLYTGKLIDAQRALQLGMLNEVCARDDLERRARYYALLISKVSPVAVRLQKEAINRTFEIMGLRGALAYAANLWGILDTTPSEEQATFRRIREERGLRAALDWRDEQFREVEALG